MQTGRIILVHYVLQIAPLCDAVSSIAYMVEVVKATSAVINNYGIEWGADEILLTAKNGGISFEQLVQTILSLAPLLRAV